ncbi:MAG: RES family NAD+ phosphorylase [Bryobacteraceae bacterium]
MRTPEDNDFIEAVLATSSGKSQEVPVDQTVWRAQIGYNPSKLDEVDGEVPLLRERMKPPQNWLLEGRAPEGRINPQGIPFLYVATNRETTIGEVRPSLGELVSVAEFRTNKPVRLINCTTDEEKIRNVFYSKEPEGEERTLAVWRDIDRAFSRPVVASGDRADYAATQFLAELFRYNGFDGVAYRSSFGPGHNIALFDLNVADVAADPQLVEVTELSHPKYSRR